ncbi:cryptochrome-1 [Selaginella moellendorffii]|uniref:cryptochrome-1 n=1 Tax=Selaginella moellendorffii TaxID=88036 RepID=UPI000D1C646F|nr:cryptochrome-1 [Selaginella moellendorffii]|eukprot:XP_024518385.1 cryptochrome-1 [Selaginella moellendorffii]
MEGGASAGEEGESGASPPAACTILVWFRRDLRLDDNPALAAAVARKGSIVVPVFVWCPEEEGQFQPGRVSRWWLKQSLIQLSSSLERLGAPLLVRRTAGTLDALLQIAHDTGASQVFYNHLYDPVSLIRDHRVKQGLADHGISVKTFRGDLLYEPWEIYDDQGQVFTTFQAFWSKSLSMRDPEAPLLPPRQLLSLPGYLCQSCSIDQLGLENEAEKSSNALLARSWTPGWCAGDKAFTDFLSGPILQYSIRRKQIDSVTTSQLSPHLHFGEISIRKIFYSIRMQQFRSKEAVDVESMNMFLRALGLREYSRYLSFNFPFTHKRSLLANLKHFPWRADEGYFKSWRQGRTGYPLVDAGMRQLWATGWLHCKIRVVVSSFLVKFLQVPWTWGMKYFWETLLDADVENDVLGWQYISGGLPDGHELDRWENPQEEGYKLDPKGEYVRKWLPELSRVPIDWIHHPWDAPSTILRAAGVELGSNYPRPIVEVAAAYYRQQQALDEMWKKSATAPVSGKGGACLDLNLCSQEEEEEDYGAASTSRKSMDGNTKMPMARIKGGGIDQMVPSAGERSNNDGGAKNILKRDLEQEDGEISSRRKRKEEGRVPEEILLGSNV